MLRIVTGPFHPDLELTLVEDVQQIKAADPLASLTIVVPSASLRQRLKWLLCSEHEAALLDVHFLTFFQFAVRLLQEAASFDPLTVRSPFFFQELVHHLLRREPASPWSGLTDMPGAWGALLATLRDLKDASIDAGRALEALSQNQLGSDPSVAPVLTVYREFLEEKARGQAYDEDDLAVLATDHVPTSSFLARQRRILYYGFYDLTQVQLDLFQTVSRRYPTTLYFPLVKGHPAYVFAERFFERYIHGLITQESDAVQAPATRMHRPLAGLFHPTPSFHMRRESAACGPASRLVSVSGRLDEATVVAKEILGLVEERGYAFQDIGVVARTLSGYDQVIPRVFDEHGIPFTSTMDRSLAAFPFVKAVMQLLEIRVSGFRRDQVIDLFSSPFVRFDILVGSGPPPRPDLWDLASRRLGITRGLEEWRRLTRFVDRDLPLRDRDEEDATGPRIPAQHIATLWQAVMALADDLEPIPQTATWAEYADQTEALANHWLDAHAGQPSAMESAETGVIERLQVGFSMLRDLNAVHPDVMLADFAVAFRRLMEHLIVPLGATQGQGVQVLDAMAARGVPFRALFVLGLNDKAFPRHIHEDPFLRDRVRRAFEMDLGYKIPEKLAGYDEETLLFYLLCNSARDELTLLYQRADDAGRPLVPSGYLADIACLLGDGEVHIPRRLTAKFEAAPYRAERLTVRELTVKLLLERRIPRHLLAEVHPAGSFIERGLRALPQQESGEGRLGRYDGITGPLDPFWARVTTHGVSPSALQEYATCPFRYYAGHVLRLEPLTQPESVDQIEGLELGRLAHRILRNCLETLSTQGYFADPARSTVDPLAVLEQTARVEFDRFAGSRPIGYPLLWQLSQDRLISLLREVLEDDLAEMAANGWEPVLFEEGMTGALTVLLSAQSETIPVFGRLDRVDWSRSRNAYRIIDYKYKSKRKPHTLDSNLVLGAVRGRCLQPPLYLITAQSSVPAKVRGGASPPTCEGVWFYYLAHNWEQPLTRVRFPGDAWTAELREPLTRTMSQVLNGIHSGHFFLFEEKHECERCDYRLLCRRTHQASAWRARTDHPVVRPHRDLRRAAAPDAANGSCGNRGPESRITRRPQSGSER